MKRFTLVTIATLLALVAVTAMALAMESEDVDVSPAAPNQGDARLAVAHLAPFAADPNTAVTVTLDSSPVLTNVEFADSTAYLTVPTGTHLIEIYPAGSATPAITKSVVFSEDTDYSAIAIGDGVNQPLDLRVLVDDNTAPAAGKAKVRIGHLAPFAAVITDTWADVRLQDGTILLNDVPFNVVAPYLELDAGVPYDLKITTADGSATLIDLMPVTFNNGDILSVFAVGDITNQPVGAYAWPSDAAGVLLDLAAYLEVGHLAPFAMDPGTAVTVTVDGAPVLTDFEFAESTGYLTVIAGTHLVEIFPAGSPTPAITDEVDLMQAMDYSAIAIGDGVNQPLDLRVLVDDNTAPAAGKAKVRIGHLAPFAAVITDTWADVRLQDGTILLDDVPFNVVAPYLELDAGVPYDLKITTADGSATLIDLMPVTFNNGDILSVFAVGDITNQPVGAFAWPSDAAGGLLTLAANLQVAHLAPFAMDPGTAVTVTVDGAPVLTDFEFAETSAGYVPLEAGVDHLVEVFPGSSPVPAITETVNLAHAMDYSAIAIGGANGWALDLLPLPDDNTPPSAGNAKVRIGHLAPFAAGAATLADVRLQDGGLILDDVAFGDVAPYLELPAGTYDLKITTADGSATLIDPMPATFSDGDILSVFAVGDGVNQPVGAFAWPSGAAGGLLKLAANLQVAHLAPFAMDPGTAVTVTVDSAPLLTDFEFAETSAGYVPLEAGVDHLIEVFPGSSPDPAITATVNLTHAMDFSAIAIGGANSWDLELLLLEDDNSPATGTPGAAKVRIGHLAPFAAGIDDTRADVWVNSSVYLPNVPYKAVTGYDELVPGPYNLELTPAGGTLRVFGPGYLMLEPNDIASVFAVGDGDYHSVAIFVWPNGEPGFLLYDNFLFLPLVLRNATGSLLLGW